MAEILRYVDPNSTAGGDGTTNALTGASHAYVSLNAWEAATQQDLTDGGGDTARVVCSSDDAGSTHAADTTAVVIDGWTDNATCFITIESASSHGGLWNDSIYRLAPVIANAGSAIKNLEHYTRVIGLQVSTANAGDWYTTYGIFYFDVLGGIIARNLIKGPSGCASSAVRGIFVEYNNTGSTAYVYNNIVYDVKASSDDQTSISIRADNTSGAVRVFNNTIYGGNVGIAGDAKTYTRNNLIAACTTATSGLTAGNNDYNATNLSALGYTTQTHDQVSKTFTFVNSGAKNFHLASNDAGATGLGVDLSGDANYLSLSTDIDGQTRSGSWDIGADEYVAAVSAALTGTATASITENDITTGGKTIVITLTGDTFIAS